MAAPAIRCRQVWDLGRGHMIQCTGRVGEKLHLGTLFDGTAISWTGDAQCPFTDVSGVRCFYNMHAGDVHWGSTPEGSKFRLPVPPVLTVNTSSTNVVLPLPIPCMATRMLAPGYAITCTLTGDHGHPHLVRFGDALVTWGWETQCPAIEGQHRLRCLSGNGHTEAHRTVNSINGRVLYWVGDSLPVDPGTLREIQQQQTLVLPQTPAPRSYAERKRGRR